MDKLNLTKIAEMSDDEVYRLSTIRPGGPKDVRGFMFSPGRFENTEEMATCLCVLMNRLSKISNK